MNALAIRILMTVLAGFALVYVSLMLAHERGPLDAQKLKFMLVKTESGQARRDRCRRYISLIIILVLTIGAIWLRLVQTEPVSFALAMLLVVLYARHDTIFGERATRAFHAMDTGAAHAFVFIALVLLEFAILEIPSNPNFLSIPFFHPISFLAEILIIGLVTLFFWLLFQRKRPGLLLVPVVLFGLGLVEYFVAFFKEMPLLPSDILATGTALSVFQGYVYIIDGKCLIALILLLFVFDLTRVSEWEGAKSGSSHTATTFGAFLVAGLLAVGLSQISFVRAVGVVVRAWCPLEDYQAYGFVPSFVSGVQSIFVETPAGYTKTSAETLMQSYAHSYDIRSETSERRQKAVGQFEKEQPSIIVVMNETFSDISIFDKLRCGYEGPRFFNSLDDYLMKGRLFVSAYGGGTCNSEFEFLTGLSLNYFGPSVYPYTLYSLDGVESISQQLADLGYETSAMHPNLPTNWNRDIVYKTLGFDRFYSLDDFEGYDRLRDFVTDGATYNKCLEILEASDKPQFIFDVTMQNHSGYSTEQIPEEKLTHYTVGDVDEDYQVQLNEYLSLIDESDRALEEFIGKLNELDRPVILVFFGDHQPYLTAQINDTYYEDEPNIEHTMRLWQTNYLVWSNYEVAGSKELERNQDLSTNFLAASTLDAIGAPLSNFEKAEVSLRSGMQALNLIGYVDSDGNFQWGNSGDPGYGQYRDLKLLQYRQFFDCNRKGSLWIMSTGPGVVDPELEDLKRAR